MGRFLFVVPPLTGHVNPTVPLGRELEARGHAVAWTGHADVVAPLLPPEATFLPAAEAVPEAVTAAVAHHTSKGTRGPAGFMASWQEFVLPVNRQLVAGIHGAIDDFDPDVLVVDQQALAGAAVAELRGVRWATCATTSAELLDPLAAAPQMATWLGDRLGELMADAGLDRRRAARFDPRFSPHLVLALTTAELVGRSTRFPDHYELVGPLIGDRPDDTPFPWDWLDAGSGPVVLASLGTLNWRSGERFFAAMAGAMRGLDARAVLVAPPDLVPDPPDNVLVAPRVPQLALLPRMAAVVCHGGHNTVCEALAQGLPLVVAPIRDDQPVVAEQVAAAGAGVRVKFARITAAALAAAVGAVLTEPEYRAAAERVRASFVAAGGARLAAERLEGLLEPVTDARVDKAIL